MEDTKGTAEDVKLEELPMENIKGEQKPWVFKKQESGKFKVFDRETEALLEGFEDMEFGSPLQGGRFIHTVMQEADAMAKEKAKSLTIACDILRNLYMNR